jgi:hypothetical protein
MEQYGPGSILDKSSILIFSSGNAIFHIIVIPKIKLINHQIKNEKSV